MRLLTSVITAVLIATTTTTTLSETSDAPKKHLARRAIDGTRGRKHFDPKKDGFYDEFGYDKSQYHGYKDDTELSDLRNNVPGEPGVDYPAFQRVPKTSFTCYGKDRGYYADEESGCQAFYHCNDGYSTPFLCPVGLLFSQRLLICDWWGKVACAQTNQFYKLQSQQANDEISREQQSLQPERQEQQVDQDSELSAPVSVQTNQLEHDFRGKHRGRYHAQQRNGNKNHDRDEALNESGSQDSQQIARNNRPSVGGPRKRGRGFPTTRNPVRYTPSREVTSTEPSTSVKISSSSIQTNGNIFIASPGKPFQTSTASYEDGKIPILASSTATSSLEPTSFGNQASYGTSNSTPENKVSDKNVNEKIKMESNSDNDDMEPKESISLVKSHAERQNEKDQELTAAIEIQENKIVEATTVAAVVTETLPEVELLTTLVPQRDENVEAKESVNEVQSKAEEKLQLFDSEKESLATESSKNEVEQGTTQVNLKVNENNVITTTEQFEKSTSLPVVEKLSEDFTENVVINEETTTTEAPNKQQTSKLSDFVINVPETGMTQETTASSEVSATEPQELSSPPEVASTSEDIFIATTTISEEPTTLPPFEAKKVSDTVEESNTPMEVTVALSPANFRSTSIVNDGISQQPNGFQTLDILPFGIPKDSISEQNQLHSSSTPKVRTYQNIRFHFNREDNQPSSRIEPQPSISTTFSNYQGPSVASSTTVRAPTSPQNLRASLDYQDENFGSTRYQIVPSTTPASRFRFSHDTADQRLRQTSYSHYRTPKPENFVSTAVVNIASEENEFANRQNRPTTPEVSINHHSGSNQVLRSRPEINHNVINHQSTINPGSFSTISQQPKQQPTFENYPQNFVSYQTTPNFVKPLSTEKTRVVTQNEDIDNYDYQSNYNAEDIGTNAFEDFGTKISANKQKNRKIVTERPILRGSTDAQVINLELGGKAANILHTMSQLIESDRSPRPFGRNEMVLPSFNSQIDQNIKNPYQQQQQTVKVNDNRNFNDFRQQNNFNQVTTTEPETGRVIYNTDDSEYIIGVDDFAAPISIEVSKKPVMKQNSNTYWIMKDQQGRSDEKKFESTNNRERKEKILNSNSNVPESVPFDPVNNIHRVPEIKVLSLNQNQNFVQVPQPNFNMYNVENPGASGENVYVQSDLPQKSISYSSQPPISYYPQQQASTEQIYDDHQSSFDARPVKFERNFRPTIPEIVSSTEVQEKDAKSSTTTTTTSRTTVETEFIPSISFDFGSDQGRMEYLDALEKGTVMSDESTRRATTTTTTSQVVSDIMDNFKDRPDVMRATE